MSGPICYEIRVRSHLGPTSIASFENMTVRLEPDGDTVLTGRLTDQAALHGVLLVIRDLGLQLVEVRQIEADSPTSH